jgi:hypothetical protein
MDGQGYQRFLRDPTPRELLAGLFVCAAAVALFLAVRITAWPPHEDETLALFVARDSIGSLLETVLGERGGAPLHFLCAWIVAHTGGGLVELRLLSALFAAASVPVVGLLVARLAGRAAALAAAVVVSASWLLLFHGVYARMYSLFLLTSALSYLALLRALERGGVRAWALWAAAMLACVAAHPYGALVIASQAMFVVVRRERVREAAAAFAAVAVLGIPFWISDLVLAGRFEVGVGGGGEKLGGPVSVLRYLWHVAGDMTAGWWPVEVVVLLLAAYGFHRLWTESRRSAVLVLVVFATPAAALAVARLGESASPESRHLIFTLPFFALLVAAALASQPRAGAVALAALAVAQVAWTWHKTPQLFEGEPAARSAGREQASEFLARTQRADDVLFGYEPLYLGAWERTRRGSRTVVPRADPKLALEVLRDVDGPLGRGVWVFDASENNNVNPKLAIEERVPFPHADFEARAFGPYLVVRTREPVVTPARYLAQAERAQRMGKSLFIGDADVNWQTVRRAAARLYEEADLSRATVSR